MKIYVQNSRYFNCIYRYFHFKYHSYIYYTVFTCIFYFYIFKVQLGDVS